MRKIVYYVATSIDGFIAGPNGDISGFAQQGAGVDQYLKDLQTFDTVIMGRNTYTFGYAYGLQPGQPAYPHMRHYIFSRSLQFENAAETVQVCEPDLATIRRLKAETGTAIYLCGGGEFAGWLLEHDLIDILKIKLNPLLLGSGIRLFGNSAKAYSLKCLETNDFEGGLQIITYAIHPTS